MTHSDVIIGYVVTSSVKLHQEAPTSLHQLTKYITTALASYTCKDEVSSIHIAQAHLLLDHFE